MRKLELTQEEYKTLKECMLHHTKSYVRKRCMALYLLNDGNTIPNISKNLGTRTRTIYSWLDNWEANGIIGMFRQKGSGRKPLLSVKDESVVELVKKS
ncbi:MAG: helix-turn-helix domain-containing protein [Lentisphaeria bacterium]|nr:helix-turn-helix domain-containing protein [Lentisphaeria bacterium]